jgi:hypothetical protein
MNPLKLFRVYGAETTSSITHNEINKDLMPEVEQYWIARGRFNHKLYDQFLRIRNTELIRTEKKNSIQVIYDHSDDVFELRQGFVSLDGAKSDLKEPFLISLGDLEKVYETVSNIKQKQL